MVRQIFAKKKLLFIAMAVLGSISLHADPLVIYSGRGERLIKPVLDAFTKKTGIAVTLHSAGTVELLNKLLTEKEKTPADIFLTVDAATLEKAKDAGLLLPVKSNLINKNVPETMRASDNSWVGVSLRLRVIAYNPQKVKVDQIKNFSDLTNPSFKGRLGLRTGSNIYPQSHTAMMIAEQGEEKTGQFLKMVIANAGDKIYPSDSRAVEAVAKGEVDAAIVNHYYVYSHLKKNPADAKTLAFHVPPKTAYNVSGLGILKYSKKQDQAIKLVEFLVSEEGQKMFSEENREYPVSPKIQPHKEMLARNKFTLSNTKLSLTGKNLTKAIDLIDKVGYR